MKWNVYYYNVNSNKIELFNIFKHRSFNEYVQKHLKECQNKDEFSDKIKSELHYYFWSKCEYELIIERTEDNRIFLEPWCGCRNPDEIKIDVTDDTDFNWNEFADEHIVKWTYVNKAKIDIYDQVMWNFEIFLDYVWETNSKK